MIYKLKNKAFTLVEVLVSLSILLLVIVGPMTIAVRSSKSTTFATEQVTAFFLAQEGAELAQKLRDDLLLQHFKTSGPLGDPWDEFITNSDATTCFTATGCALEIDDDDEGSILSRDCDPVSDCDIYLDEAVTPGNARSRFTHDNSGNTDLPFRRVIRMDEDVDDQQIKVTSTVTWRTGSLIEDQSVVVDTYLFNIYDTP